MAETGRILRALGRIAFAGGLLALGAPPARSTTFTVTDTVDAVDTGVGDGLCSAIVGVVPGIPLPFFVFGCTLRAALQEANFAPGEDTIIVPAGSFGVALAVTGVDDAGGDLDVTDDVVITGAGRASTILDASGLPAGQPALAITDPTPADGNPVELRLAGVTIADAPDAGLFSETPFTHFELDDVVIRGSGAYGIRKNGVALDQITNSRIAESTNAGLFSAQGDLDIASSVVEANGGGGILNLSGALTVMDSTIRGNTGGDGGIRHQGTSLLILRSTIHDNHSTNRGGGLRIEGGSPNVIRDTTFSANGTTSDGGAISTSEPFTIANSTLSGNQANGDGGGVFASSSPAVARIQNCTIYGNAADADANATGQGGGIAQDYFSEIRVRNSVLANNTAAPAVGRDCAGTIVSEGYNVVRIDDCGGFSPAADREGSDGAPLDAELGPLADNGGPTLTQMPAVTSPVVDFGAPAGCPIDDDGLPGTPGVALLADQRGAPRPRDGDGDHAARCDVGAVEVPEPGAGATSIASWLTLGILARRIQARRVAARSRQNAPVE